MRAKEFSTLFEAPVDRERGFSHTVPFKNATCELKNGATYRIYSSADTWTVVEAASAREALEKSGIKWAIKICRELCENILAPKPMQTEG